MYNKDLYKTYGAILFIFGAVALRLPFMNDYSNIRGLVWNLSLIVIGVGILAGRHIISAVGAGVAGVLGLIWTAEYLRDNEYWHDIFHEGMEAIAFLLLMCLLISTSKGFKNPFLSLIEKYWFLPGLLDLVGWMPVFIKFSSDFTENPRYFINNILRILSFFLVGIGLSTSASTSESKIISKHCYNCGMQIGDDVVYCKYCGSKQ